MAVYFQKNEVELKRTGHTVDVPDNETARLMYYLNCVCTAVQYEQDSDIQRFTNYNRWASLSIADQRVLLALCYTFSPDVLNDKVFFHSDALCGDSLNEFYEINQVSHQLIAAQSIIIAGQTREVRKIMTYQMRWMEKYYLNPMRALLQKLSPTPTRPAITYRAPPTPTYVPIDSTPATHNLTSTKSCCNKGCIFGSVCGALILLAIVITIVVLLMKNK